MISLLKLLLIHSVSTVSPIGRQYGISRMLKLPFNGGFISCSFVSNPLSMRQFKLFKRLTRRPTLTYFDRACAEV